MHAKSTYFSCIQLFAAPWTITYQTPLSMGFSRQEYWSGLPFPPSGNLPDTEIKPHLLCLLLTKVQVVKAMVLPVVMHRCESWTIKKAQCQRIDAFELWFWRRLLRVPRTARRSNQSILKEISPKYSLEGLMLKLKLQYTGHLM